MICRSICSGTVLRISDPEHPYTSALGQPEDSFVMYAVGAMQRSAATLASPKLQEGAVRTQAQTTRIWSVLAWECLQDDVNSFLCTCMHVKRLVATLLVVMIQMSHDHMGGPHGPHATHAGVTVVTIKPRSGKPAYLHEMSFYVRKLGARACAYSATYINATTISSDCGDHLYQIHI